MNTQNAPSGAPEPKWCYDEDELKIERHKEQEWRKLAEDLKAKEYLSKDADINEFVDECREYASDVTLGLQILFAAQQINVPFSCMLLASAVLVREAEDLDLTIEDLSELKSNSYVNSPTKEPTSLNSDVGELVAWIASVVDNRPQRMPKHDVDKNMVIDLTPRLNETTVLCFCKKYGCVPKYESSSAT
ncbi:hypothetical protein KW798_01025 [Candidatus Parcubacteria bacterium]|nr:hypothetical protein [Candidatus Parcubacteria bacterium]